MTPPVRPETPTLDALWSKYGIGASRYTVIRAGNGGAGLEDAGLQIYYRKVDYKNDPADVSGVSPLDVQKAEAYIKYLDDYTRSNGGFLPGESPNEKPISQKDLESPAPSVSPSAPVVVPAARPVAPAPVVTPKPVKKSFWQRLFGR